MSVWIQRNRPLATAVHRQWSSRNTTRLAASVLPTHWGGTARRDDKDDRPQVRAYHSTASQDRAVAIMLGLGTVAAVSYSAAQGVKAYNEWKESWPDEPLESPADETTTTKAKDQETKKEEPKAKQSSAKTENTKRENIFKEWFGVGVGAKYYEGGFEDTMTRREAALILGT